MKDENSQPENFNFVWINGKKQALPDKIVPLTTTLNQFLRNTLGLTGTKVMCAEGGCGACVVHVRRPASSSSLSNNNNDNGFIEHSINSCLVPLFSCVGWHVTTIEALRSITKGDAGSSPQLHPIQERVRDHHGTQCGYCTPGFCMQQFSTLKQQLTNSTPLSEADIERTLDGNICRCTGYRPILDAMKSFANKPTENTSIDIEDLLPADYSPACNGEVFNDDWQQTSGDNVWYAPSTLSKLWQILKKLKHEKRDKIRFIAGNTSEGVYKSSPSLTGVHYVNLANIRQLYEVAITDESILLGALVTQTQMINIFKQEAEKTSGFRYLLDIAEHLQRVASHSVRNAATWAGNLALKHAHPEFPSDLATCLEAAQAHVVVADEHHATVYSSITDLLKADGIGYSRLITQLILRPMGPDAVFPSYKVAQRETNAHAYVNAAVHFPAIMTDAKLLVAERPLIAYGGFGNGIIRAFTTEAVLLNTVKNLADWNRSDWRDLIFDALKSDLSATMSSSGISENDKKFKTILAQNLLYKAILKAVELKSSKLSTLDERVKGAWKRIERPVSSGRQTFETNKTEWPLTQPVVKLEADLQTTGRAKYASDMNPAGCLYAAPILSPAGPARLVRLDTSTAYAMCPGIVKILTARDIPGENNFMPPPYHAERLLVPDDDDGCIMNFAGEPIGIVVATTPEEAARAAKLVCIEYEMVKKPILTIEDAIEANAYHDPSMTIGSSSTEHVRSGDDIETALAASAHVVSGTVRTDAQYHFTMETHVTVAEPQDDGDFYVLHSSTQWPSGTASSVAQVLGISSNAVDVQVQRIGGGFGCKQNRGFPVACMAALGACVLRRPVKMQLSLQDNMTMIGTRHPYMAKYRAGFSSDGMLQAIDIDAYFNVGTALNDFVGAAIMWGSFAFKCPTWHWRQRLCRTDLPPCTVTRAPGFIETEHTIQTIMEHAAYVLKIDGIELRRRNLLCNGDTTYGGVLLTNCTANNVLQQLLDQTQYEQRKNQVRQFNAAHRWRKRAIAAVLVRFEVRYEPWYYSAIVDIHYHDGSVSISHAGVEMGQGINTKAVQTCAHALGVPPDLIRVKTCTTLTSPNSIFSAASVTSEMVCYAVEKCAQNIRLRMETFKQEKEATDGKFLSDEWSDLVRECHKRGLDLSERFWVNGLDCVRKDKKNYSVYGAAATEVELDVLTGERQVRRMDVVYDIGQSVSPAVDVGQAEGALIMGLGVFMSEKYTRDENTGALLSNSTWHYKPPAAADIPIDMRVSFLKNAAVNEGGVQRSKAVGEPPILMSSSVMLALRAAVMEARKELSGEQEWVDLDAPATPEKLLLACQTLPNNLNIFS